MQMQTDCAHTGRLADMRLGAFTSGPNWPALTRAGSDARSERRTSARERLDAPGADSRDGWPVCACRSYLDFACRGGLRNQGPMYLHWTRNSLAGEARDIRRRGTPALGRSVGAPVHECAKRAHTAEWPIDALEGDVAPPSPWQTSGCGTL